MSPTLRAAMACATLLLFAGPAYANCNGGPFAGPYVGADVGYGHLKGEQSSPNEPDTGGSDRSLIAGVLVGYGIQCGRLVFGLEADISHANLGANSGWPDPILLRTDVDWFGTMRGRLGATVHDNILVYATGGLAYAEVSHAFTDPVRSFSQTDSGTQTGWTLGGGVEVLRSDRWLLRAEVLYVDLGSQSHSYTLTTGCGTVCTGSAHWDDSFWIGRVGLSIKLGGRQEHIPLK